jgi:hypothetical protein
MDESSTTQWRGSSTFAQSPDKKDKPTYVVDDYVNETQWMSAMFIQCLKEFVAVVTFFLLFSRLGVYSLDNAAFTVYLTLVIFNFPYLNPYLLGFVYFVLTWKAKYIFFDKPTISNYTLRKTIVFVALGIFQILGAVAAAFWRKNMTDTYGTESMDPVTGGSIAYRITKYNGTVLLEGPRNIVAGQGNSWSNVKAMWFLDEWFAVMLFLIGVAHINEAFKPTRAIVQRTEEKVTDGTSTVSETPPSNAISPPMTNTYNRLFNANHVPVVSIFYICVLAAGISRTFPTAHLSLTSTAYLSIMQHLTNATSTEFVDLQNDEPLLRMAGGVTGTLLAGLYAWFIYRMLPGLTTAARALRANPALFAKADILRDTRNGKYMKMLKI